MARTTTRKKPTSKPAGRARSQQGDGHKPGNSYGARMNAQTRPHAFNHGTEWESDDLDTVWTMIENDERTVDMAMAVGRTWGSLNSVRAHLAFAGRHPDVFKKHLRRKR